ncbi:unnamed protein product [Tenebrio molitor]|nr:unnamed protein product [Tenebrio molitor]
MTSWRQISDIPVGATHFFVFLGLFAGFVRDPVADIGRYSVTDGTSVTPHMANPTTRAMWFITDTRSNGIATS